MFFSYIPVVTLLRSFTDRLLVCRPYGLVGIRHASVLFHLLQVKIEFWSQWTTKMRAGGVGRSEVAVVGRRVLHNKFAYRIL